MAKKEETWTSKLFGGMSKPRKGIQHQVEEMDATLPSMRDKTPKGAPVPTKKKK